MTRFVVGMFSVMVSLPIWALSGAQGLTLSEEGMALFEEFKSLESRSHQQRILILQKAEACIQTAGTPQAYRECEQQERAEWKVVRDSIKAERQQLRQRRMALKRKHKAMLDDSI